ncbi:MAG: trypsin-like peptidase domain-containing protein [Dehalococcoidales bacterium]|jgi:S1-C subfamily serine protease
MKKVSFKFIIGLLAIMLAGSVFIAGCQLFSNSSTTTTSSQSFQSTTTAAAQNSIVQTSNGETSIAAIYNQASPAVVEINVTVQEMGFFGITTATDQGSGFLIDTNGDIVTNNHVVEGATSNGIQIVLANGTTINNVQILGTDATDDLAVVKVAASAVAGITPLQFDDSGAVQVGQTVVAIGSPYGLVNTLTAGIVSGVNRQITETDSYSGTYINLTGTIQTDAAINPGNSGGPLLDTNGKVIGVNTEIQNSSDGGIAFAVSSDVLQKVLPNLIKGITSGTSS